jgi:hypothetical protein
MSSEIEELKQVVAQLQKQVGRLSGTSLPNDIVSDSRGS